MSPNVVRVGQVGFLVNRGCDYRRDIPQIQVLRVTEVYDRSSVGRANVPGRVARFASGSRRQQFLPRCRAGNGIDVAIRALPPELQMQLMGKLLTRKRAGK